MDYQRFIEVLVEQQSLRENDLNRVNKIRDQMQETSLPLLLVKLGLCSEKDIATALAKVSGYCMVDSDEYPGAPLMPETVSLRFLKEYHVVAIEADENKIVVAVMDPEVEFIPQSLALLCEIPIEIKIGVMSEIDKALDRQYGEGKSQMGQITDDLDVNESLDDIEHLKDLASEAPIIRMVNLVFQRALETKASDIHIEPFEQQLIIRLRIDGVLQQIESPPATATAAVISRIKLMAKLNISEKRLPQDGRFSVTLGNRKIDVRLSTMPVQGGESVVLRLLDQSRGALKLAQLGMTEKIASCFRYHLKRPHGMILVTGPTGSGK